MGAIFGGGDLPEGFADFVDQSSELLPVDVFPSRPDPVTLGEVVQEAELVFDPALHAPTTTFVPPPPTIFRSLAKAAETRPAVPSAPGAIAGMQFEETLLGTEGTALEGDEMGLFGFLKGVATTAIGVAEGITGFDVPFVGPGDRFFGGASPGIPGGRAPLSVAGLQQPRASRPGFGAARSRFAGGGGV